MKKLYFLKLPIFLVILIIGFVAIKGIVRGKPITYYGVVKMNSTSGDVRFRWYDIKTQKVFQHDNQYAWFFALPSDIPYDPVATDKWVKYIQDNRNSIFKIIGTQEKDDCDYYGPEHCVESINIEEIEIVKQQT